MQECGQPFALFSIGSQSGLRHVTVRKMKEELEQRIEELGPLLPHNSLDELIDGLGGPSHVSEVRQRKLIFSFRQSGYYV